MRVDPIKDVLAFLTTPSYSEPFAVHYVYWLVAILSLSVALACWRSLPDQARGANLPRYLVRVLVGTFWWQQSLWAFPTDTGALRYWTEQEARQSAFAIQGAIVKAVILPVFTPFAVCVYAFEVLIAVMLMLGLYTRLFSTLGVLFILNLYIGLYRAPQELPWSYVFLIVLMVLMAIEDYGLGLGLDAYREARSPDARRRRAAAMG